MDKEGRVRRAKLGWDNKTPLNMSTLHPSISSDVDKIKKARGMLKNCLDCGNGGNKK